MACLDFPGCVVGQCRTAWPLGVVRGAERTVGFRGWQGVAGLRPYALCTPTCVHSVAAQTDCSSAFRCRCCVALVVKMNERYYGGCWLAERVATEASRSSQARLRAALPRQSISIPLPLPLSSLPFSFSLSIYAHNS